MTHRIKKLLEQAEAVSKDDKKDSTIKGYVSDFNSFKVWCKSEKVKALPATEETVMAYFFWMATEGKYAHGTIEHHRNAINHYHIEKNHPTPVRSAKVNGLLAGLKKTYGKPPNKKHPLTWEEIKSIVDCIDQDTLKGCRDKAIILIGYAGGLRVSEISTLKKADIQLTGGLSLRLQDTKTDKTGDGQIVNIASHKERDYCPLIALLQWLETSKIKEGYIFRGMKPATRGYILKKEPYASASIRNMLKGYAAETGLDPRTIGGHSLRRGVATTAINKGADIYHISKHLRHKDVKTTEGYCDFQVGHSQHNPFNNAAM